MNMRPSKREQTAKQGYVYATDGLLNKINFLAARKETPEGIVRRHFEENRYLSSQFVDFGFQWEVHPAYRWALQGESVCSIFETLALSVDGD